MSYSLKKIFYSQIVLFLALAFCACTEDQNTVRLEVLEIFKVKGNEADKEPTDLRYKDVKQFDAEGFLEQQNFYNVDNTIKGYEFIKRDGNSGVTNYYNADSTLLAIYELEYVENRIVKRTGYDGVTKELLRTENFKYDKNGNMQSKTIIDPSGATSNGYVMEYDANGNEVLFRMLDSNGSIRIEENFVISKSNKNNLWTERWGYIENVPNSFHRRSFSYDNH